jgi:hypothetical protein
MIEADHGSKIAVGETETFVGRGELDPVSFGELPLYLAKNIDSSQAAGVVAIGLPLRFSFGF